MNKKVSRSQEFQPSFSMDDFAHALEQYDYKFDKGQIVQGKVFQHTSDGAYVDINGKSPGFVPLKESSIIPGTPLEESLPLQQAFDFLIISQPNAEGQLTLSRRQLAVKQAWQKVGEIAESGETVQILITGVNKGGVVGEVEGLRGFIPRSHLSEQDNLDSLVGQTLTANFLQVEEENNKLVLSQRKLARAQAMSKIETGALLEGKVVKIQPYGAFISLSGVTGLLHIKQISNNPVASLSTLLTVGQTIKVYVAEVDEYQNRISLSTKVFESYPGEILEQFDLVMANAEERLSDWQSRAESATPE